METPAAAIATQSLVKKESALLVGQQLGHYRIVRELGRGGMGVIYLAQDTILGRHVALKLFPATLTGDPDRLRRFEREAHAASALNHPNILTIHEIAQVDDVHFIATEFVDGLTLREQMRSREIDLSKVLDIAAQIASALAAAHEAGIVHRDIKPENVMLRRDGYVKVLDFGLAKLTEVPAVNGSKGSTALVGMGTDTGIAGTAGYMSPEQARGESVDQRTDIFSLGVVLYEMTAGAHPFKGPTAAATFDALLNREPVAPTVSNPDISPELERIISRALEKDRELRYQTASDLRSELKRWQRSLDSSPTGLKRFNTRTWGSSYDKRHSPLLKAGLILAALIVIAAAVFIVLRRPPPKESSKLPKNVSFTQLTDQAGTELFPNLSPDGKSLVYASKASGNWDVYLQRVGGKIAQNLTTDSTANDTQPAFSPDGERIAFRSERDGGGICKRLTKVIGNLFQRGLNITISEDELVMVGVERRCHFARRRQLVVRAVLEAD